MGGDIQVIATRDTRPSCATRTWWHCNEDLRLTLTLTRTCDLPSP